LFEKHGLHDFVHTHCTLRSHKGNFTKLVVIFITPVFAILAVYIRIKHKPCIMFDVILTVHRR